MAKENSEGKRPSSLPDGISSIADDEAITEIDFNSFLEESSDDSSVFAGFHDDIEQTEKNLADELDSLYDDIMSSGPATIVPKPISAIVSGEEEQPAEPESSALDELWLNPEEYIEPEIPVVSLDGEEEQEDEPAPEEEEPTPASDEKNDLFSMIDSLKADTDGDTGFSDILSEIETNDRIVPVNEENLKADDIVTAAPAAPAAHAASAPSEQKLAAPAAQESDDEDDFDYESELAALLGDEPEESEQPAEEQQPAESAIEPEKPGFVVEIPDDGNDYEAAAAGYDTKPLPDLTKTVGSISTDESKFVVPEEPTEEKPADGEKKKVTASEIIRKIVLAVSIITIIVSSGVLANTYIIEPYNYKKNEDLLASRLNSGANEHSDASIDDVTVNGGDSSKYPSGMLAKYAQLYDVNSDLAGWISIPALEINLPVVKGADNSYYLRRNIYKKRTDYGVPFFDYRISDLKNLPRNTVVYGHNMRHDDLIFGMLENYREISGFKSAPVIECNTIYGDQLWFVYAVFITNSRASDDNGYIFPYNFIDVSDAKFAEYITEIDKRKLYTTGVDINPTDKILTLSTCCYDFDEARLVVVARMRRAGESSSVNTSNAMENPNPKYPQAWYDANKKTNPYAADSRW